MAIKIIDNRKIDITEDEYMMYDNICKSYNRANFRGSDLFKDLFETDDNGMIVFLRPPSNRHTSMEVFMFLMVIMQQQTLRFMHRKVDNLCAKMEEKMRDFTAKMDAILAKPKE